MPQPLARSDTGWMQRTLEAAGRAWRDDDEVPVAALIVDASGRQIASGTNRTIAEHDPTAHAEVVALREAGRVLGNYRLDRCTVYVSLEPCAMCAMAMVHARITRLVYGASNPKAGACGSVFDLLRDPRHNHRVVVDGGVMAEEAGAMLSAYFAEKRRGAGDR